MGPSSAALQASLLATASEFRRQSRWRDDGYSSHADIRGEFALPKMLLVLFA